MAEKRGRMRRPAAIGDILRGVFAGTPAEKRLKEGRIWLIWEEAVGSRIASHAVPAAFRDGTLTLTVDSAPWMQQLNYLKREIVAKVNAELGEPLVRDLFFKAGPVQSAAKSAPKKESPRRALSDRELSWVNEQSEMVEDPELRAVFEKLIKRDLENR